MSQFKSVKNDPYYKQQQARKFDGPKPSIHFYPDVTDEILKSNKYDIDWILSYADAMKKINALEDDIHTPQMVFANAKTADSYELFVHYLDIKHDTQRIAHIGFNMKNEVFVKEWV